MIYLMRGFLPAYLIDQQEYLANLYDYNDGDGFEPDEEWGCNEGTHTWNL